MKFSSIIALLLIAMVMFLDASEARKTNGSSGGTRGGTPSSNRGGTPSSSNRGGNTSSTTKYYKKTTYTKMQRNDGTYFSGAVVITPLPYAVIYPPFYYNPTYHYYHGAGGVVYREATPTNPIVTIVIVVIVIACVCLCCYIASKQNYSGDDAYEEEVTEVVEVTETVNHGNDGGYNGPPAAAYAPGTNPPGTALCNAGHIFAKMYQNPYNDDTATCDNCQQIINWNNGGGYHCSQCEVDLCANCGMGRESPAGPPGYPPGAMPNQGFMPPNQGFQQPGFQQPGFQQPGFQQPGFQQPGFQQPGFQQPGFQQPGFQQQQFQQPNF